jgi:glycosyltransferase involved in cell wall biosynthesis
MVLFVSYSGLLGGAERVLLDAVMRLERDVAVLCPDGPLAQRLEDAGVARIATAARPLRLSAGHALGVAGLARDIRRAEPEFVVAWGARAVLSATLESRPWLAVHHDLLSRGAVRAVVRAATRTANGVAAASHAIAREVAGGVGRSPAVAVLHPGVDLERFSPRPLPDGPPRVLVLGALVEWKRPELALQVAERLPHVHITIAGAALPGDGQALERRLRATAGPNVTIAGPVEDVPRALAEHHALLHCADREPYGMVLVEALAAGRPVVAPGAAGPKEILGEGLYGPGDAEAAADEIAKALADPQAPTRARHRAEAHFDVRDSTRRLQEAMCRAMPSS